MVTLPRRLWIGYGYRQTRPDSRSNIIQNIYLYYIDIFVENLYFLMQYDM